MTWHIIYGSWWMIQWCFDGWVSFGIHIDFKKRRTGKSGIRYSPYMDVHLLFFIFSVGVNPYFSTGGSDDMAWYYKKKPKIVYIKWQP